MNLAKRINEKIEKIDKKQDFTWRYEPAESKWGII